MLVRGGVYSQESRTPISQLLPPKHIFNKSFWWTRAWKATKFKEFFREFKFRELPADCRVMWSARWGD